MDNFMDKLAQKFTAQEMIKANQAAEAQEMKRLRAQISEYEGILQEMRGVSQKNMEEIAQMQGLARESLDRVQKLAEENLNKATQAEAAQEADAKLAEEMAKLQERLAVSQESIEALFRQSDDFVHKENVKVYRNVQAVVVEELKKQSEQFAAQNAELVKQNEESRGIIKGMKPLLILTFAAALANIVLLAVQILGIL